VNIPHDPTLIDDLCVEQIGVVRFDDLSAGVSWEFIDPVRMYVADHIDQVIPVLMAATHSTLARLPLRSSHSNAAEVQRGSAPESHKSVSESLVAMSIK